MGIFASVWLQALVPKMFAGFLGMGELMYWLDPKPMPWKSGKWWLAARFLLDAPVAYCAYVLVLAVSPSLLVPLAMLTAALGGPSLVRAQLIVLGKNQESEKPGRVGPEALHSWFRSQVDWRIDNQSGLLERRTKNEILATSPIADWPAAVLAEECLQHLQRMSLDKSRVARAKEAIEEVLETTQDAQQKEHIVVQMLRYGFQDYLQGLCKEASQARAKVSG